jgi:ribonucleoside-triphosphate reductase
MMDFAAQSNSFGGGGSVSLGSHRVCTINFNRVALEAATKEEFYDILDHRIEDAAKILKAHKELIKKLEHIGLQPFITNGWININRLFSTFGIMGIYEATKLYKEKFGNGTDIEGLFLTFMNDKVKEYSQKYGIIGNIEQIPGESFSSRLCNADKLIFGEKKVPYMLYANQFVPLWEESTVWDKMDIDGKYNKLITGGGIVHIQIGEKVTAKQAEKLIKYAVTSGCEHFALNAVYSECENNHNTIGKKDVCPECGAKIIEYRTRVVGFFVPVSSWDKVRREWEFPKRKFSIITEEFGLIESHSEGLTLVKQCA